MLEGKVGVGPVIRTIPAIVHMKINANKYMRDAFAVFTLPYRWLSDWSSGFFSVGGAGCHGPCMQTRIVSKFRRVL